MYKATVVMPDKPQMKTTVAVKTLKGLYSNIIIIQYFDLYNIQVASQVIKLTVLWKKA